jgi:hypothetical protein
MEMVISTSSAASAGATEAAQAARSVQPSTSAAAKRRSVPTGIFTSPDPQPRQSLEIKTTLVVKKKSGADCLTPI